MLHVKPIATPLPTLPKLSLNSGSVLSDPQEYRKLVGTLQYLALTLPDISYAVIRLSQFMHRPTTDHFQALKRVLRYLSSTTSHGIFLRKQSTPSLHAFSDADWTGDSDDYVSTNSYIRMIIRVTCPISCPNPISWTSKKQKGRCKVFHLGRISSCRKYRLRSSLGLFTSPRARVLVQTTLTVYYDNISATYLCANPVFHTRMKHIALDYHFVRGQIQTCVFWLLMCPRKTSLQIH